MQQQYAVVVTTINYATAAMVELQRGACALNGAFYVIGDSKSPSDFSLEGARYYDLRAQKNLGFRFAEICPTRHYARKNIGYLAAMRDGASVIIETDDDNFPRPAFFAERKRRRAAAVVRKPGWCNAYAYYTEALIWPRGLPLDRIKDAPPALELPSEANEDCPIQQGLADGNPDVDAIFRLLLPLPFAFEPGQDVILSEGVWCPFNSQNTTWFRDAFPLMYLPFHCSFRMTDIWRGLVAQRLAWECGWRLMFHGPTVHQERNDHDLMRDFADEVPGYLENDRIRKALEELPLDRGRRAIPVNLVKAYDALIGLGVIADGERPLLRAWLDDLETLGPVDAAPGDA